MAETVLTELDKKVYAFVAMLPGQKPAAPLIGNDLLVFETLEAAQASNCGHPGHVIFEPLRFFLRHGQLRGLGCQALFSGRPDRPCGWL